MLRKAAVAGGIAWTAPVVASSRAGAASACTPKCQPSAPTVTATPVKRPCAITPPTVPPSDQFVVIDVTVSATATCGCSGAAVVSVSPSSFVATKPTVGGGIFEADYPITVTLHCVDRDGDTIRTICPGTVHLFHQGNCNNTTAGPSATATVDCGAAVCLGPLA